MLAPGPNQLGDSANVCHSIWFLFVETKGPTLEEIAELFDGPKAPVSRVMEEKAANQDVKHVE